MVMSPLEWVIYIIVLVLCFWLAGCIIKWFRLHDYLGHELLWERVSDWIFGLWPESPRVTRADRRRAERKYEKTRRKS